MAKLLLSEHVSICFTRNHCVFLNLRRDEYTCLCRADANAVGEAVIGWPESAGTKEDDVGARSEATAEILQELMDGGLLVSSADHGKQARPISVPPPVASLVEGLEHRSPAVPLRAVDIGRFLAASALAGLRLRRFRLETLVGRIAGRKARNHCAPARPAFDQIEVAVRRFHKMRPWLPARNLCLFDSLALVEFLSRYRIYPVWVFGVQTEPFHAHCWVQEGDVVLNDRVEHVRGLTPIMAI